MVMNCMLIIIGMRRIVNLCLVFDEEEYYFIKLNIVLNNL